MMHCSALIMIPAFTGPQFSQKRWGLSLPDYSWASTSSQHSGVKSSAVWSTSDSQALTPCSCSSPVMCDAGKINHFDCPHQQKSGRRAAQQAGLPRWAFQVPMKVSWPKAWSAPQHHVQAPWRPWNVASAVPMNKHRKCWYHQQKPCQQPCASSVHAETSCWHERHRYQGGDGFIPV